MIEVLLGINRDSWEEALESSRTGIRTAGRLFLAFAVLMLFGGIELMHGLTGSWWIGVPGGLFAGIMMANIVRLALITVTVRIPDKPEVVAETETAAAESTIPNPTSTHPGQTEPVTRRLTRMFSRYFQVAGLLRLMFMGLVAAAMSFPVAAFFMRGTASDILNERRKVVIHEFEERHPDYAVERLKSYRDRIGLEYFPIHVYMKLSDTGGWKIWFMAVLTLTFLPYAMLHRQHVLCSGGYFDLNGKKIRRRIVAHHESTLSRAEQLIRERYAFALPVPQTPDIEWENPPFNTIPKKPNQTGWRTNDDWETFLKGT